MLYRPSDERCVDNYRKMLRENTEIKAQNNLNDPTSNVTASLLFKLAFTDKAS